MVESERLARRYFTLFGGNLSEDMLEIVHPEIELILKSRPGHVLHGREEVTAFVKGISERFYETVAEVYRPVDANRIVVEGRMRWTDEHHVMRDDPVIWALEFREGMLYRSTPAQTVLEAQSILMAAAQTGDDVSPA